MKKTLLVIILFVMALPICALVYSGPPAGTPTPTPLPRGLTESKHVRVVRIQGEDNVTIDEYSAIIELYKKVEELETNYAALEALEARVSALEGARP